MSDRTNPLIETEAEELLESPDLLPKLEEFISTNGLVGEEVNRRLILLAGIGGHLGLPIHVIVKGPSSGGKNNLVKAALSPLPQRRIRGTSYVSEKALSRSKQLEGVLLIDEAEGQQAAEYAIRVAMSEGRVGNFVSVPNEDGGWEAEQLEAEISASIITTTTSPALHAENQTRVFDVEVDASRDLTRAVLNRFAAEATGRVNGPTDREREVVQLSVEMLSPEDTIIHVPYAEFLSDSFPDDTVRARRDFPRVLRLIRASALLHQRQRERNSDGHLIADPDDYRIVYPILQQVLASSMTGLTETARQLCKLHDELAAGEPGGWVRRTDLQEEADRRDIATRNTVHKWCKELSKPGVAVWEGERRGPHRAWYHRKLRDPDSAISLPRPEDIPQ